MHLQPEFGNWMVEAVPSRPYASVMDPEQILSCVGKLERRRKLLEDHFLFNGLAITTLASPINLGTDGHIVIRDSELAKNIEECKGDIA